MIYDSDNIIWGSAILLVFALFFWCGYELGYKVAKQEYTEPVKYRCHEGVVYRSVEGMWQKSGTECKKLEEIK